MSLWMTLNCNSSTQKSKPCKCNPSDMQVVDVLQMADVKISVPLNTITFKDPALADRGTSCSKIFHAAP